MQHQPALVRWSMPLCVGTCIIMCLLPSAWLDWTNWFGAQARVVISPIAHPMTMAKNLVIPQSVGNPNATQRERTLQSELDRYRALLYREQQENTRLTARIDEITSGAGLTPNNPVIQIPRPVTGISREFLVIRSGGHERITRSTVVVVNAVQLCGRVTESDDRTALVLPITAKDAQPLLGYVMLDDTGKNTTLCMLSPIGKGLLEGDVTIPTDGTDSENLIQVGMEVRLYDDQWPRHAQMLLIGKIESIAPSPNQPLRQRITVRPSVDLRAVPEVYFRVPDLSGDNP
ncbi:MAG: rod shape-determining protein MreC [Phycisphaerales bacterium]|nr:rod shape-determining protein MreC [Phycisphaerales bacterium]